MMERTRHFVPWSDGALLAGESAYALWNKIAWFGMMEPTALVRRCKSLSIKTSGSPQYIAYEPPLRWLPSLHNHRYLPRIRGHRTRDVLTILQQRERDEVPTHWRCQELRICPSCITHGVHLRIHQHLAVGRCPVHGTILQTTCPSCGAALPYGSRGQQAAFSCPRCEASLLDTAGVKFDCQEDERARIAQSVEACVRWLACANLGPALHNCRGGSALHVQGPLAHLSGEYLTLAAYRASSLDWPPWLRGAEPWRGAVVIAAVAPRADRLTQALSPCRNVTHWLKKGGPVCEGSGGQQSASTAAPDSRPLSKHYHQALMRVTNAFLRRIHETHTQCLDTPYRLVGEDLVVPPARQHHLLACCPVALGFWLWRQRSGRWMEAASQDYPDRLFRRFGLKEPTSSLDLLLYALERSHLHACILMAFHCHAFWERTHDAAPCVTVLHDWLDSGRGHIAAKSAWLDAAPVSGRLTFVRVDAGTVLDNDSCPGAHPLYEAEKEEVRASWERCKEPFRRSWATFEDVWRFRASRFRQVEPFAQMSYGWAFLGTEKFTGWRPGRAGNAQALTIRRMAIDHDDRHTTCRCLTSMFDGVRSTAERASHGGRA